MAIRARSALLDSDGFDVMGLDGSLGIVEEVWVGEDDQPSGFVVRLPDGQRGLLEASDVTSTDVDAAQVHVAEGAHVHHLEWHPAPHPLPLLVTGSAPLRRRPVLGTVVMMLGTLAFIVCALIGLDFLFAYWIGGGPPY